MPRCIPTTASRSLSRSCWPKCFTQRFLGELSSFKGAHARLQRLIPKVAVPLFPIHVDREQEVPRFYTRVCALIPHAQKRPSKKPAGARDAIVAPTLQTPTKATPTRSPRGKYVPLTIVATPKAGTSKMLERHATPVAKNRVIPNPAAAKGKTLFELV